MNRDSDDRQLRAFFHEALGNAGTNAPEFAAVWEKAARRRDSRVRALRLLTLAAMVAVVVTIAFLSRPQVEPTTSVVDRALALESRDLPWRSTILLTEWRAPSDAILSAKLQP